MSASCMAWTDRTLALGIVEGRTDRTHMVRRIGRFRNIELPKRSCAGQEWWSGGTVAPITISVSSDRSCKTVIPYR